MSTESYLSEPEFHSLVGRALIDHAFRDRVLDPRQQEAALKEMGIDPTPAVLDSLNQSIDALTALSAHFGMKQAAT
jgi:hypothetical protein